jgi:Holliday junction resolvase RusA-like endonuclease
MTTTPKERIPTTPKERIPTIKFFVPGIAKPAGSKVSFNHARTGKIITMDSSGKAGTSWRSDVKSYACDAMNKDGILPFQGSISVWVTFYKLRPKNHFNSKGILKPTAPKFPTTVPDSTKLWRGAEDALKTIAWRDDSQVVDTHIFKRYRARLTDVPGMRIIIKETKSDTIRIAIKKEMGK